VLQSARFDGPRGYAITAERTDPLFTIDLSNPAEPRQVGELVMPGWVYYLEPRGDRLLGLGFDQNNPQGAITVSLFDVANLAQPKMLSRVNFGGEWGQLPEDQDRIHKAFKVSDELGLILVPFSGWQGWNRNSYCATTYRSGVQLVDFAADQLSLRGMVPSRGEARRAILAGSRLFTISDEAVDTFDVSKRDEPAAVGTLTIARNVSRALPLAGGIAARINEDWYASQNSTIDFAELATVDDADRSLGELNLSALLSDDSTCASYTWVNDAFSSGSQVNLVYQRYGSATDAGRVRTGVLNLNASDPKQPRVASKLEWDVDGGAFGWGRFYGYYRYGYSPGQTSAVRTETALVLLEQQYAATYEEAQLRVRVIDLRDPARPSEVSLALPAADGYGGLVENGRHVLISHYESSAPGRVRFYVTPINLTNPDRPLLSDKINVPGSLLHYDRASGRALTSELSRVVVEGVTPEHCYQRFADYTYDGTAVGNGAIPTGTCTGYRERLHLVRFVAGGAVQEDTVELGERERLTSSSLGEGRMVAVIGDHRRYGWGGPAVDCIGPCGYGYSASNPVTILTLGGFELGRFTSGRLEAKGLQEAWWGFWGVPNVYASGQRALVLGNTDAAIIDLSKPASPAILRTVPLYSSPMQMQTAGNTVLVALGRMGVQRIEL
jgi:hypothetical protein